MTLAVRRLRWLLYGQFAFALSLRYRRWKCGEHEPVSVRVGKLREFTAGGQGRQRVVCRLCAVTLKDY